MEYTSNYSVYEFGFQSINLLLAASRNETLCKKNLKEDGMQELISLEKTFLDCFSLICIALFS